MQATEVIGAIYMLGLGILQRLEDRCNAELTCRWAQDGCLIIQ